MGMLQLCRVIEGLSRKKKFFEIRRAVSKWRSRRARAKIKNNVIERRGGVGVSDFFEGAQEDDYERHVRKKKDFPI